MSVDLKQEAKKILDLLEKNLSLNVIDDGKDLSLLEMDVDDIQERLTLIETDVEQNMEDIKDLQKGLKNLVNLFTKFVDDCHEKDSKNKKPKVTYANFSKNSAFCSSVKFFQ